MLPSGPGCPARALGQKRVLRSAPLASERSLQTHLCMDPTRSDPSTRWGWGRDPEGLGWGVTLAGCVTSGRTLTSLCWQPHLWHQHNAGPVSFLGRLADKTQLPLLCTLPCLSPTSPPSSAPLSTVDPWVRQIPWRRAWQPTVVFLPGESPWTGGPGGLQSMGRFPCFDLKGFPTFTAHLRMKPDSWEISRRGLVGGA